jgi:hypothetical protein
LLAEGREPIVEKLTPLERQLLAALEAIIVRFDEQEAIGISTDEYEAACAAIAQAKGE